MKNFVKLMLVFLITGNHLSTNAQVSGIVFRDFNANGIKDNSATFNELPVAGITVKAFNNSDALVGTTTTNASGAYTFTGLALPLRIEFSNLLLGDFASPYALAGSKTNVQFYTSSTTAANFGVNYPNDFSQVNPQIIVPVHDNGSGVGNTRPGIGSFLYNISGIQMQYGGSAANLSGGATVDEIGAVWGLSYQKNTKRVFASSFLKTGEAFANGPGYIYVLDYSSANPSLVYQFNLQSVSTANGGIIDLGSVNRTNIIGSIAGGATGDYQITDNREDQHRDLDAFGKVGKMSFGDNELSEDGKTLWVVNLFQKALIKVDVSNNNTASLPGAVNQYLLASLPGYPSVSTGVLRPWALKFYRGKGYLGIVNDGSIGTRANLQAYVLSFDPNNITAGFATEITVPLNFDRESYLDNWKPWLSSWAATSNPADDFKAYESDPSPAPGGFKYAQPILSNIEFQPNGDMLLGFRDRLGDQLGANNYVPISGDFRAVYMFGKGDLLKACKIGGTYVIEGGNAGCGTNFTGAFGPNNNGEFFKDDNGDGAVEGFSGGLAIYAGANEIVSTMTNPKPPSQTGYLPSTSSSQGIHWNNLTSGAQANWYQIDPNGVTQFGKANGLGDIEILSNESPIEIGNRVWFDANADGIQSAGESGISNVTLELFIDNNNDNIPDGAYIATTNTNSFGEWYFNSSNITSDADPNIAGNQLKLTTGVRYIIRPSSSDWNLATGVSAGDLSGYSLTNFAVVGNGQIGYSDNDAQLTTGAQIVPQISYLVGQAGQNNHNLDFGFKPANVVSIKINSFSATQKNSAVELKWMVTDQINIAKYEVETSGDGRTFTNIATTSVNSNQSEGYSSIHSNPVAGVNYYRIKSVEKDGSVSYSEIRKIIFSKAGDVLIYPTPVSNAEVNITLTGNMVGKTITVSLISMEGKLMSQQRIINSSQTETIDVSKLANGNYILKIMTDAEVLNKTIQVMR
jgi:SdrD B-like domain/Secretion system C-terminal sorting domain